MSSTYIIHHHRAKRTRTWLGLAVLALLVMGGGLLVKHWLQPTGQVSPTPSAKVTHVLADRAGPKYIDDNRWSFDLPSDWEAFTPPNFPPTAHSWRNTADNKGVRVITVYYDGAPANFAVNRVVPVLAEGAGLGNIGDVSDNCINFTNHTQPSPTDTVPAKWQNTNFVCDVGNHSRNVVGTASLDGLNIAKLTGPTTGAHSVFITFTDASASPNFGIFTAMLQSFQLK